MSLADRGSCLRRLAYASRLSGYLGSEDGAATGREVVGKHAIIRYLLIVISTAACATDFGVPSRNGGHGVARNRRKFPACRPAPSPALPRAV